MSNQTGASNFGGFNEQSSNRSIFAGRGQILKIEQHSNQTIFNRNRLKEEGNIIVTDQSKEFM